MEKMEQSENIMGISLLHKCNFNCEHCGYIYVGDAEDHNIKPGYRLTWSQVMTAISDCLSFEGLLWNINFTGGEPTLWKEGEHRFLDMLLEVDKAGIIPAYNTNGSYFDDFKQCRDFFHEYSEKGEIPLRTFISMDKFHKNYDEKKGRAASLDNVTRVLNEMPSEKRELHKIHVITIVTNDPHSSLPAEMKNHYGKTGITFGDFPMLAIGKAKNISDQLPNPPDFTPPVYKEAVERVGAVLVGEDYYHGDKKVARLGHLKEFYDNRKTEAGSQ